MKSRSRNKYRLLRKNRVNYNIFDIIYTGIYLIFVIFPVGGIMIVYDHLSGNKLSEVEAKNIESVIMAPIVIIEAILFLYIISKLLF